MKKDKNWLKAQVKDEERELKSVYDNYVPYEKVLIADDVNELIDQLDEPEVPVIPQFVADWIEDIDGNKNYLFRFIMRYPWNEDRDTNGIPEEIIHWIFETDDNILLILKLIKNDTDYTIEKEKTYLIRFDENQYARKFNKRKIDSLLVTKGDAAEFTEQEIKAIDERYWAFAEEVTDNV